MSSYLKQRKLADRLFAVQDPRIAYLVIPKCGCTFVKNVLWMIINGKPHDVPQRVHDSDSSFLRASSVFEDFGNISSEPLAFSVLRNPVDRFLSLYFDKIIGEGREKFVPLADFLIKSRGLIGDPLTIFDHRHNLHVLLSWLEENLSIGGELSKNPHWTPQSDRANIMRAFDLRILVVDQLTFGLELLMRERVSNIRNILDVAERNESVRTVEKNVILIDDIRRRINKLYATDRFLYRKAAAAWEAIDVRSADADQIPRFRTLERR